MPNFKKLVKNYEKVGIIALQKFIRIPSVYDESTIKKGQPYGQKVKEALDYLAKLGEDYGFAVDRCDGYATELSIGEEGPLIGIYGHSDVVPVSGTWTYPPFSATLKDGVIYGRGACDDKGPLIASLYAVKLLKDNGLLKGYRVKIVSGGDEERGSSCLKYYFEKHHGEAPRFGFTPDADWPLVYAEKGITHGELSGKVDLGPIIAMDGGVVANAVCDSVLVTLKPDASFGSHLKNDPDCDVTSTNDLLIVRFKGKTAHGSTPELGINAMKKAFEVIGSYYKNDYLRKLSTIFDNNGKAFGGYFKTDIFETTYNFGIVNYNAGILSMTVDFRYGKETPSSEFLAKLQEYAGLAFTATSVAPSLQFDRKSPLVSTLMKAYKAETHQFFAKPLAIGGGTYAKEAPNTLAFGAAFPKHPGNMHSPDEYIYVSDFLKDIAIYAHAIHLLGNIK